MKQMFLAAALVWCALAACPGMAAMHQIPAGGTVFIGEEGLDLSAATGSNNEIAWFPSTASTTSTVPEKTIDISATRTQFYVSPAEFSSRTGNWYCWSAGWTLGMAPVAFRVDDPYLILKVEDTTVGLDVTSNQWIYRGDEAQFRIESNLYTIVGRMQDGTPVTNASVTIKLRTPDGAVLTAVTNKGGMYNLSDIPVTTSPFVTGPVWDTGSSTVGTYTVWAECNVNGMKDNYPVVGKTVSTELSLRVTDINPLINSGTTTATTRPETTVTTPAATAALTTAVSTTPPTMPGTETAPPVSPAVSAAVTVQETPVASPTRTSADGFTALLPVAAFCAAAVILFGRPG